LPLIPRLADWSELIARRSRLCLLPWARTDAAAHSVEHCPAIMPCLSPYVLKSWSDSLMVTVALKPFHYPYLFEGGYGRGATKRR
jgi:hypothetical protein